MPVIETMAIPQSTNKSRRKRMWPFEGMSLETATLWGEVANLVLISCLAVGVIATFVIVRTTDVKEHHWNEARDQSRKDIAASRTEADTKIGVARADADAKIGVAREEAKAAIEKAHAEISTARSDADEKIGIAREESKTAIASANKSIEQSRAEAATARLQAEQIKASVVWRDISPVESATLEKVLAASPGLVNLRYTEGDPEALFLCIRIGNVLGKAMWRVGMGSFKPTGSIPFGIFLTEVETDSGRTLEAGLKAANISFVVRPIAPDEGVSAPFGGVDPNAPTLLIGSRTPLAFP